MGDLKSNNKRRRQRQKRQVRRSKERHHWPSLDAQWALDESFCVPSRTHINRLVVKNNRNQSLLLKHLLSTFEKNVPACLCEVIANFVWLESPKMHSYCHHKRPSAAPTKMSIRTYVTHCGPACSCLDVKVESDYKKRDEDV